MIILGCEMGGKPTIWGNIHIYIFIYIPTCTIVNQLNVYKYTIHWSYQVEFEFFVLLSVSQRTLDLQPEVISILVLKVGILGSRSTLVPLSENRPGEFWKCGGCEKLLKMGGELHYRVYWLLKKIYVYISIHFLFFIFTVDAYDSYDACIYYIAT